MTESAMPVAGAIFASLLLAGIYLPALVRMRQGRKAFLIAWLGGIPFSLALGLLPAAFLTAAALLVASMVVMLRD